MAESLEVAEVRERLRYDTPFWSSHCATILNEDKVPVRLVPRPWQARTPDTPPHMTPLDEALEKQRAAGQPMRAIILKARKLGFSTWVQAKMLQRCTQLPFQYAITAAHLRSSAGVLADMATLMYERLPTEEMLGLGFSIRPQLIGKGTTRNGSRFMTFGQRQRPHEASLYETLTAGARGGGRATTPNMMHGSEVAHFEDEEYLTGLLNALPMRPETLGVLESTAKGFNFFHKIWENAVAGQADPQTGALWAALFYGWQDNPYNARPFVSDQARERFERTIGDPDGGGDEEEPWLVESFGTTLEQLNWRRAVLHGPECRSKVEVFHQEHPACLTAETRVSTNMGIVPIANARAAAVTESGSIKRWGPQPASQIYRLTTKQGRVLRGTHDHPVQAEYGLVGLSELEAGTKVVLRPPMFADDRHVVTWKGVMRRLSSVEITPDFGRWIGYFMGDGCWHAGTIAFALDAKDQDVVEDVSRLTTGLVGVVPTRRDVATVQGRKGRTDVRVGCVAAREAMEHMGLVGTNGSGGWRREIGVPECIWRSPREVVCEFLRGLFECDGSASQGFVRWGSYKLEFARDVQLLLLGFGLNAVMHSSTKHAGNGGTYQFHALQLGGDAARKFHDEIGFIGARKRGLRPEAPDSNTGRPCVGVQLVDEVLTVEEDGFEVTYDFTMDTDEHLFMANGIVTHNTPEQAFIGSGDPVFAGILIARAIKSAEAAHEPVEGVLRGLDLRERRTRSGTVEVPQRAVWVPGVGNEIDQAVWGNTHRLRVWEHPLNADSQEGVPDSERKPDGQYIVFVDVAQGEGATAGEKDYHAIQVLDHVSRMQVASYRSRIPLHDYPLIVLLVALYYNGAMLAPEVNGPGIGVVDALAKDYRYPRIYRRRRAGDDRRGDERGELLGWQTDLRTKPLMEQTFGQALKEGTHGLRCVHTGRELTTYISDDRGRHGAQKGAFDDLLMAIMGAHRVAAELKPRAPGKKKSGARRIVHDDLLGY